MKMNMHLLWIGCFFFISFEAKSQQNSRNIKPNIIIILSDDQGWGDLGFTGNKTVKTPNIDRLAKNGAYFNRFFVNPVCSPTRAELLTGRYHVRSGVTGTSTGKERMDLDETTIAEIFKSAGYKTAAYGKWHNGAQAPYHPNSRGFDDFYGFCSGHWGNYFNPTLEHNGKIVEGKGFITDDLFQHGIKFIDQNLESPFFLYLPLNTPHSPMQVPTTNWNNYENKTILQKGSIADKEQINHTRAALALAENIDTNVGRLIEHLEKRGMLENTIIIYFSDNGPNGNRWNGEMKGIKGSTDEGGVRSPLIINWKENIPAGRSINSISSVMDLLPTLTDLAGITYQTKKPLDGISLKNQLVSKTELMPEERTIINYWEKRISVRSQRYRLSDDLKLYDMFNDPNQTTDISKSSQAIFESHLNERKNWEKNVLRELPEKDTRPFVIGHPNMQNTILTADDAKFDENIQRSSKHPNDSYLQFTKSLAGEIYWNVHVDIAGDFDAIVYYNCSDKNIGTNLEMTFLQQSLNKKIKTAHTSDEIGRDYDRYPRDESYVKNFKSMNMGTLRLMKGEGILKLNATQLNANKDLEFKRIVLKRKSTIND